MSMKTSSDTIGNRIRDVPAFSAVPQPTAPPRAPVLLKHECHITRAVSITVLSPQKIKYGFDPRPFHVGFVVDNVVIEQVSIWVLYFPPVSIILPGSYNITSPICYRRYVILANLSIVKKCLPFRNITVSRQYKFPSQNYMSQFLFYI